MVRITRKASPPPANLRMARGTENDGASIEATWGVPADAIPESNHMWGHLDEYWTFSASKEMKSNWVQQRGEGHVTADRIWVRDKGADHSNDTVWYNRANYHPRREGRYLKSVTCKLSAGNSKGKSEISSTLTLLKPRKPVITMERDESTGIVTTTITTDEGTDRYERYDTHAWCTRQDNYGDYKKEKTWGGPYNFTDTEKTFQNNWDNPIVPGQWIKLRWYAYARGLAGNSDKVCCTHVYAHPAKAQITSIVADKLGSGGVVTVKLKTNHNADTAPVDEITMERLTNTAISSAASAALSGSWESVDGAEDDFWCGGFCDAVEDAMPDVKKHTWYRLRTQHDDHFRYSDPVEATCLYRTKDAQANDRVLFSSIGSGADGESVTMKLAWNNDDSTDTEVSWSIHEDAWESSEEPETYMLTWEDDPSEVSGWTHSANMSVRGLEEGVPVYVRARRALVDDDTTYGPWCYPDKAYYPVTPATKPSDVVLTAPASVERGQGIDCSWTFTGAEQTAWNLYGIVDGTRYLYASGEDSSGGCSVPAERISSLSSVQLLVSVTTGGEWVDSEEVTVTVADAPTLSVTASPTITAQPLSIGMTCSSSTATVLVYLTAGESGVTATFPNGTVPQAYGESIWSVSVNPEWTTQETYAHTTDAAIDPTKQYYAYDSSTQAYSLVENPVAGSIASYYERTITGYTATVTAPTGLSLYDGGVYDLSAVAVDGGLSSAEATAKLEVDWAHKAGIPGAGSTVAVDSSELTADVTPAAPSNYVAGDVCDVYRVTRDGAYLIAADVQFGNTVTDRFAPFSSLPDAELAYRLCTRTSDGDLEWTDVAYLLDKSFVRLDWDGGSIEAPYDVVTSSSWAKGFELVERMDGTRVGSWSAGATRTEQMTFDLVKMASYADALLITELAQHAGPVFVRTPNGSAFEADVQVTDWDVTYESAKIPIALDATEVSLTQGFMVQPGDWSE